MKDTLDLQEIIKEHGKWLRGEGGKRANLLGADLQRADLQRANLQGANLQGANLQGADLLGADLQGAHLQGAYLQGAHLRSAYLRSAHLRSAHLQGANLQGADLQGANLQGANLQGADLRGADLKKIASQTQVCPQEGAFTAWKKGTVGALVKLEIPADAKRLTAISSRKCRAECATVLGIWREGKKVKKCGGLYDKDFIYEVGETVHPDSFDDDPRNECSNGIHFFITREEAEAWEM